MFNMNCNNNMNMMMNNNFNNNNMNMMMNNNNMNMMMNNNNMNMINNGSNMMNNNNMMFNNNNQNFMNMLNNNMVNNMNMMNNNNFDISQYYLALNMMLLLNPSLNMNNQMNFMKMMINFMSSNPYFFQKNNNSQNNTTNINIIQQNDEAIKASKKGGILPRKNDNKDNYDSFPGNNNERVNIIFITGTGAKFQIHTPIDTTVENLLIAFIRRVNLDKSVIGKMIYFLINGQRIPVKSQQNIIQYGLNDSSIIIVADASNLIGGRID